jgi:putative transposase
VSRHHTTRLSTFEYRGTYRYSWTICTEFRARVLVTEPLVAAIRSHFLAASTTTHVAVLAYCFMPDHVHLLIEGLKPDSSALHFIDRAKQSSGYWYARQSGRRLWQKTGSVLGIAAIQP